KPCGQSPQVKEPGVLVHVTSTSQPPLLVSHSLMSSHPVAPVPVYPLGHAPHVAVPALLVHEVRSSQPPLSRVHGSIIPLSVPPSGVPPPSGMPVAPPQPPTITPRTNAH